MTCPNCGSPIERGVDRCPKCGAAVYLRPKRRRRDPMWMGYLLFFLVFGTCGGCGLFEFQNLGPDLEYGMLAFGIFFVLLALLALIKMVRLLATQPGDLPNGSDSGEKSA